MKNFVLVLFLLVVSMPIFAGGGPENLFLVVNADDADSIEVANTYIQLRKIPAVNVLYLKDMPKGHAMEVDTFRDKILTPIKEAIKSRGLEPQIDYVIYSTGFPHGVNGAKDAGTKKYPQVITKYAAITSLTFLHELTLNKDPNYYDLASNYYFRRPDFPDDTLEWSDKEKELYQAVAMELEKYENARRTKRERDRLNAENKKAGKPEVDAPANEPDPKTILDGAGLKFAELLKGRPDSPALLYDFACIQAQQGLADDAMKTLTTAVAKGWKNKAHMARDRDLNSVRGREDFKKLIDSMPPFLFDTKATIPFRHEYSWNRKGDAAADGRHYWLSAMLGSIGPRANTCEEVLNGLERAVKADETAPKGTFYFMLNDDVRSTTREWAVEAAADQLKKLGMSAEIQKGIIPKDAQAVMGAFVGISNFDWKSSNSTMVPGAIAEHLTSCGGMMEGTGQTNISEFIRFGAAGSSGTVQEPYALQNKFPNAFIHVHYVRGASLAEAFYQSVLGPYQLLILGDPLCQPYAKRPHIKVEGLTDGAVLKESRTLNASATGEPAVQSWAFFVDGVRQQIGAAKEFVLKTETLNDGWHEARVVGYSGAMETQGNTIIPFTVNRQNHAVTVEATKGDDACTLKVFCSGAQKLVLKYESVELQQAQGEKAEWNVSSKEVSFGQTRCWVEAYFADAPDKPVRSAPIEIHFIHKP